MKPAEWIEVMGIGLVGAAGWLLWPYFPTVLPCWQIVLGLSALLLAQSLVRDVAILFRRQQSEAAEPPREAQCFCLESTVGVTGIVTAAALAGLGSVTEVTFHRWQFFLVVAATPALGFLIKDWVISWNPFGLRREKDHLNLIVHWKRKSK
jgi:hypothetical protein